MKQHILIVGSLAYDRIMDFPGRFSDYIVPEKIHTLSVAFRINRIEEKYGGTGGNVAYSLSLLGASSAIIASAGKDFDIYRRRLRKLGVATHGVREYGNEATMSVYVTTDKANNQISAFYKGAMTRSAWPSWSALKKLTRGVSLALVSASNESDMQSAIRDLPKLGVPYIIDFGQQIPYVSSADLLRGIEGARALTANDYELALISRKTKLTKREILRKARVSIITLGEKGAEVIVGGKTYHIPAVKLKKSEVVDPTGAGDAYRAGLAVGYIRGYDWPTAARIASIVASFPVCCVGTQEHFFSWEIVRKKYRSVFGKKI